MGSGASFKHLAESTPKPSGEKTAPWLSGENRKFHGDGEFKQKVGGPRGRGLPVTAAETRAAPKSLAEKRRHPGCPEKTAAARCLRSQAPVADIAPPLARRFHHGVSLVCPAPFSIISWALFHGDGEFKRFHGKRFHGDGEFKRGI